MEASSLLGGKGVYVHWGVIQLSVANLVVIGLMIVVFALAVVVPFGHSNKAPKQFTAPVEPSEPVAAEQGEK